ncbi:unnamed protein product, partial [Mesorhabditis belari]|uniref:Uncharacterized protein n=1 Tax=Mesorhabditis belari TaxID=2138241 RepID=A0AAF3FLZ5_9BILA
SYYWKLYTQNNMILNNLRERYRQKLKDSYKTFKTPSETGVEVWIEVWVQEVNAVNELASDFDMDIYVTEFWWISPSNTSISNPCRVQSVTQFRGEQDH